MSVPRNVQVTGTEVVAHAGEGDQYVFSLSLGKPGREPRKDPDTDLLWLGQRYVYPAGFASARELLRSDHRTVLLDGPPGSGRTAAAKMLLWELRDRTSRRYELPLEEPPLDLGQISVGDGLWFDLSDIDPRFRNEVHLELSSLRERVLARSGWLVVILPHQAADLAPQFEQFRVAIGSPHASEVFRRHLRWERLPQPRDLSEVAFLGQSRSLGEVAAFVQRIARIRADSSGEGDLASWVAEADEISTGADLQDAAQHVTALNRGAQRAFLLAASMLNGARADAVSDAAEALLRQVGHPDEEPVLERPTMDRRLGEIHARRDAFGVIRFTKPGHDAAVRAYMWAQLPHLHEPVRDWVAQVVDSDYLTDEDRAALVNRFMDQCLDSGTPPIWSPLVTRWTMHPTRYRATAAGLVLRRGLQDERHSRAFRRRIYWWSRDRNIPPQLAEVMIAACRDEIALTHPEEALVRLHHLARHGQRPSAREALAWLVSDDRWLLRLMLSRLPGSRSAVIRRADAELFLEFAQPAALTDPGTLNRALLEEELVRDHLVNGWRLTYGELESARWEARAADWLRHAAADVGYQEELLDVLTTAGEFHPEALACLFALSTRDTRTLASISDLLLRKIDAVSGLQPEEAW